MRFTPGRILIVLAFLVIACGGGGSGSEGGPDGDLASGALLVRWRPTTDAVGYVIHWGAFSGVYDRARDVGAPEVSSDGVMSFPLDDVDVSGTVYFALTSYDDEGRMSGFSNELAVLVP